MRIKAVTIHHEFKRFRSLSIVDLPEAARLVVLTGPNGSGKSSLFDAFRTWHGVHGISGSSDELYYRIPGRPRYSFSDTISIEFFNPPTNIDAKKILYIRSAYRHEADFTIGELRRMGPVVDSPRVSRLIDMDISVAGNYQRIASTTIDGLYQGRYDDILGREIRESIIGQLRQSMRRVFYDLILSGLGDPLANGTFLFEKVESKDFHYKNLSGGEKAAFDLLLDMSIKRQEFDDTVFCIDEPELHMHTKLQGRLLEELVDMLPGNSQLWIASHSIGMMRKAKDMQEANRNDVVFLDFSAQNFDDHVTLRPQVVNRRYWANILEVALDDLASLVAPRRIVLCEGKPATASTKGDNEAFDARCYDLIFAEEFPDTEFISVGSETQVRPDKLQLGKTLQMIVSGTTVIRLVDRDARTDQEISDLKKDGVMVLTRRHLEAYLMDDEVLLKLCISLRQPDKAHEVLAAKQHALNLSVGRTNPSDDLKSAAGNFQALVRKILQLDRSGNTTEAFLRDILAPLVTPGMAVYEELKRDVFGQ